MRVWRGIFTKKSRMVVLEQPFWTLPPEHSEYLVLILDKILDNFSNEGDERKLTSFTKSMEVALEHAGTHGWLIELEVSSDQLLDSEPFLEKARSEFSPNSDAWKRITEALEMTHMDEEMFLKRGAVFMIRNVSMVGSYHIND